MQNAQFDGKCLECLSCYRSHFRAHFCCFCSFLCFLENKLNILRIYVNKVVHIHEIKLVGKSGMV